MVRGEAIILSGSVTAIPVRFKPKSMAKILDMRVMVGWLKEGAELREVSFVYQIAGLRRSLGRVGHCVHRLG